MGRKISRAPFGGISRSSSSTERDASSVDGARTCRRSLVPSLPRLRDISNGLRQAGGAAGPPGTIVAGSCESHGGLAGLSQPSMVLEGHRPRCPCWPRDITRTKRLYLWAPRPVPLQLIPREVLACGLAGRRYKCNAVPSKGSPPNYQRSPSAAPDFAAASFFFFSSSFLSRG